MGPITYWIANGDRFRCLLSDVEQLYATPISSTFSEREARFLNHLVIADQDCLKDDVLSHILSLNQRFKIVIKL